MVNPMWRPNAWLTWHRRTFVWMLTLCLLKQRYCRAHVEMVLRFILLAKAKPSYLLNVISLVGVSEVCRSSSPPRRDKTNFFGFVVSFLDPHSFAD